MWAHVGQIAAGNFERRHIRTLGGVHGPCKVTMTVKYKTYWNCLVKVEFKYALEDSKGSGRLKTDS